MRKVKSLKMRIGLIGHTELVEVQSRFVKTFSFKNNSYESI